ncbi:hypothetical protein AAFF_G00052050 [Aldrovandia affinis]|uniref:RING-type E3 ubiquitin transferase n=1 Tax=Aldrovandia affinis TaxID=143900 RepID=A0AAD7T4M7_9TELE|nr:hypothetical protein AAFF_G00052050 [Aldrovandia affinis]
MEGEGRTIIVCGVPLGIEEKRLTDKLCIHFLRKRHGGGEISSIALPKSTPGCALITFEDSEVAQRVVECGKHILSVDDKTFELTVSLFCKEVDPDEVFLRIAVTVDYSRLPLGKLAVSSLRQNFPDVHFSFVAQKEHCNMKGRFSEVQALITQLLSLIDPKASVATCSPGTEGSVDTASPKGKSSSADEPVYHLTGKERQMETGYAGQSSSQDLKSLVNSERSHYADQALESYREGDEVTGSQSQEALLEEYFLVMDSDIFRYLRQHCGEQYQHILSQHGVEAVEVCTQDITTVYLQVGAEAAGQEVKHLKQVQGKLGRLYQEKEAQLRKELLPKEVIATESLQQSIKALEQRLPKLLLSQDKTHIYIVGSGSDVSEAKQFLLDMRGTEDGSRLGKAGYTKPLVRDDSDSLFLPSTSTKPLVGHNRDSLFLPSTSTSTSASVCAGSIFDEREIDMVHKSYRKDKIEAGKEYKLNARFMEEGSKTPRDDKLGSDLGGTTALRDAQKDFLFTASKTLDNRHRLATGPVLGSGGLGVAEYSLRDQQELNQTGNDLFLRRPGPLYSTSVESKYLSVPTSTVLPSKPMQFAYTKSTVYHMDLETKKAEIPPPGLGGQSQLRRVNSFSGRVRPTQDPKESTIPGGSQGKTNRARTSSLSDSIADTKEVYSVAVLVPVSVWLYMKDCYIRQIENITTDLHVKESMSGSSVTLHLRGADSARVGLCQKELRNLVAIVTTDFCTKELSLAKLGVTNPKDESLEVSCMELQSTFDKVKILPMTKSIFIMGPNQLCGQVVSKLMEVFHSGMEGKEEMEENVDRTASTSLPCENQTATPKTVTDYTKDLGTASGNQNLLKENIVQTTSLVSVDVPQYSTDKHMGGELGANSRRKDNLQEKDSRQRENKHDSRARREGGSQSEEEKDPMLKLGMGWTMSRVSLGTETSLTQPTEAAPKVIVPKDSGSISLPNLAYPTEKAMVPKIESNPKPYMITYLPPSSEGRESSEGKGPRHQGASVSEQTQGKNQTQEDKGQSCLCGASRSSILRMACGIACCPECLYVHACCKVCPEAEELRGIKGTMSFTEMCISLSGHIKDTTVKIAYVIPDGIQGKDHPNPGAPFHGDVFHAYLPLNRQTRKLLPQLKRAFDEGLTFTVTEGHAGGRVTWGSIPHKTKMNEGKSKNGYPDSSFLSRLTEALKSLGIEEEDPAKAQVKIKN